MLGWIIRRRLAAFERAFDYDATYMRQMLETSRSGFMRFGSIMKMTRHREDLPLEAWYAAKIAATLAEDCGPCTQLVVKMAEQDGVAPAVLRAIVAGDAQAAGDDAGLALRFARAALAHEAAADTLRAEIIGRWGQRALVTLALAIAASRVFPTVKYVLGHGQSCSRVRVAGVDTRPGLHTAVT